MAKPIRKERLHQVIEALAARLAPPAPGEGPAAGAADEAFLDLEVLEDLRFLEENDGPTVREMVDL